jgi:hypothetical protein
VLLGCRCGSGGWATCGDAWVAASWSRSWRTGAWYDFTALDKLAAVGITASAVRRVLRLVYQRHC